MSTSLSAVELWAKAVVGSEPWTRDPNMLPIPWREVTLPEQLCFGESALGLGLQRRLEM
jgi:amidase